MFAVSPTTAQLVSVNMADHLPDDVEPSPTPPVVVDRRASDLMNSRMQLSTTAADQLRSFQNDSSFDSVFIRPPNAVELLERTSLRRIKKC